MTQQASGAAARIDVSKLAPSGSMVIRTDGMVVNSRYVRGSIDVRADNVTIVNTVVDYSGYHSIRIYPGADGTRIINSKVLCRSSKTNGVMPGNYHAERVDLKGCRNDFMFSKRLPAVVRNSTVDGVPFSNARGPLPTTTPTPTGDRTSWPTPTWSKKPTSRPKPTKSEEPTSRPEPTKSEEPTSRPTASHTAVPTTSPAPSETVRPTTDPTPTGTARPTTSPRPSPTAAQPDDPAPVGSTGVPTGLSLRSSGSITVTQAGTVLDGLRVHGTIRVEADNVTIRNTLIEVSTDGYPIMVTGGVTGTLIERVEIDMRNSTGIGIYFQGGSGTVRYANIHSAEDGIRIEADNVVVERSYIHDLYRHPGGHHDTIQIRRGDNVTIRNNNLQAYNARTGDPMNAALQIGSLTGSDRISNLRVLDNLMNGGSFTVNGGGRGEVDSAVYSGNHFGRNFRYGVQGNLDNSTWDSSNVYLDNGAPAR